ncbi:MAG: GNAT family N-acetyltransferase [Leucobacter sp.]|nr:GNAT family N-acetyltransferase [Leucobacter sp.]
MSIRRWFRRTPKEYPQQQAREQLAEPPLFTVTETQNPSDSDIEHAIAVLCDTVDRTLPLNPAYVRPVLVEGERHLIRVWSHDQLVGAAVVVRDGSQENRMSHNRVSSHIVGYLGKRYRSLDLIAVDPNYRRQGVGELLLRSAEVVAHRQGARFLTLIVKHDSEAVAFFQEAGYDVLELGVPLVVQSSSGAPVGMPLEPPHCWGVKQLIG